MNGGQETNNPAPILLNEKYNKSDLAEGDGAGKRDDFKKTLTGIWCWGIKTIDRLDIFLILCYPMSRNEPRYWISPTGGF